MSCLDHLFKRDSGAPVGVGQPPMNQYKGDPRNVRVEFVLAKQPLHLLILTT